MPARPATARRRLQTLDDERLARLSATDRAGAFAALYTRHQQALYRYCLTIVRDDADAQDALQATWLRALTALGRGERDAPVRPWLFRIAHNESISILRRRARGREQVSLPAEASVSVEEDIIARERFAQLLDDLQVLPEQARRALILRELTGLSHEEIARSLQITVAAAKQSVYEARRGLLEQTRGRAMECGEIQRRLSDGDRRVRRARIVRAHMRDCVACAVFAASIDDRRRALEAFTPSLEVAAAGTILSRVFAGSSGGTGGAAALGTSSGGGAATSVAAGGAAKALGAGLLAKTLVTVGVAATAAGVTVAVAAGAPHRHRRITHQPHPVSVAVSRVAGAGPMAAVLLPASLERRSARGGGRSGRGVPPGAQRPHRAAVSGSVSRSRWEHATRAPARVLRPGHARPAPAAPGVSASAASAGSNHGRRAGGHQPHGHAATHRIVHGSGTHTRPGRATAAHTRSRSATDVPTHARHRTVAAARATEGGHGSAQGSGSGTTPASRGGHGGSGRAGAAGDPRSSTSASAPAAAPSPQPTNPATTGATQGRGGGPK